MKKMRIEGLLALLCVLIATALPAIILKGQKGELSYDRLEMYFHEKDKSAIISLEEYTAHVTQGVCGDTELPSDALEALSVAMRTQALLKRGTSCDHDYCDDPGHSLPYAAVCEEKVTEAVKNTSGLVLSSGGALVPAFVHYSSYLVTESSFNLTGREISCLVSVSSPEVVEPTEKFVSFEEAKIIFDVKLGIKDYDISNEIIPVLNSTGRAKEVRAGENIVSGIDFAAAFELESACFKCERGEEGYTFTVYGRGNGLGMSICGAAAMAEDGMRYFAILIHYYPESEIVPVYKLIK